MTPRSRGCGKHDPWPDEYTQAARKAASRVNPEGRYDRYDAYQEAALRLWKDCPDPDNPQLCYVVARRGIIDWLRVIGDIRRTGDLKLAATDPDAALAFENEAPVSVVPDHAEAVVEKVEAERRHRWLWRWIPHLPDKEQQVVRLYLKGHSTREIGHGLGMRIGTVYAHMTHARNRLRKVI